jgi:signal peptidase I
MENTIIAGDVILASKLTYGPRMPYSVYEIPWLNLGYLLFTNSEKRMEPDAWTYYRFKGITHVQQDDIVVFNGPFGGKNSTVLVKRCKGLPGDTITMKNGKLYVNSQVEKNNNRLKHHYAIHTCKRDSLNRLLHKEELAAYATTKEIPWVYNISGKRYDQLKNMGLIDSSYLVPAWGNYSDSLFTLFGDFHWTRNDYGPVIIPARGMTIKLDSVNYFIYRKVILLYEKESILFANGTCLIHELPRKTYTFKHNYYWMMGDNRYESMDSRSWGFVPEQNIIGKASRVIYSSNNGKFKWNRILKRIK